jgi:hypothetical protein
MIQINNILGFEDVKENYVIYRVGNRAYIKNIRRNLL